MTKRGFCILTVIVGLLTLVATQAPAAVVAGEQFTIIFSETSPQILLNGATATITLGPLASPGFFSVSNLSVISGTTCLTCGLETEVLTGVLFDAATLDLSGHVTGTFLGAGGGQHSFDLSLSDAPTPAWVFTNNHLDAVPPFSDVSSGTYRTIAAAAAVPEASTLLLFGAGLVWLGGLIWRGRDCS